MHCSQKEDSIDSIGAEAGSDKAKASKGQLGYLIGNVTARGIPPVRTMIGYFCCVGMGRNLGSATGINNN
jgi:hypothetical protein